MHVLLSCKLIGDHWFSLVQKTLIVSLTHKITNVPNSQNTQKEKKKLFLLLILTGYFLAISFECQQKTYRYLLSFRNLDLVTKIDIFVIKQLILADVPSSEELPYTELHCTHLLCNSLHLLP